MNPHLSTVRWPYPPAGAPRRADIAFGSEDAAGLAAPVATGIRIVVNGRVVVHHHALHDTVESMVRRAVADASGAADAALTLTGTAPRTDD